MLPLRLMAKVKKSTNGCWHWTGYVDKAGYGHLSTGSRTDGTRRDVPAHRHVYECVAGSALLGRSSPAHLQVDHECHNRSKNCPGGSTCLHRRCVNPAHLRAVPAKTNILAGKGYAARYAKATHCKHGHEFTPENTYLDKDRHRSCKRCRIDQGRENRRAKAVLKPKIPHYQTVKTHCPFGHPYNGDNLYIKPDGARACRICMKRRSDEYRERQLGRPLPGHRGNWTHCVRGHELAGNNLYVIPSSGKRQCRTCKKAQAASRRH